MSHYTHDHQDQADSSYRHICTVELVLKECLWAQLGILLRAFSRDVTTAMLVFQNNKTAAMLVFQTIHVGVELFSYILASFCFNRSVSMLAT